MDIFEGYKTAIEELYKHVGFTPDYVVCPIDDCTDMFWETDNNIVGYAETKKDLKSKDGYYYEDDIYTQRFYDKWIYEGKEYTMIFCDPHVDGMKWFRIFDNKKKVKRG